MRLHAVADPRPVDLAADEPSVYRACAADELRHTRIGAAIRIALEDLEAFVARGR
ncbi:MAG TPA: helix-turn-helix domain-containing protein [Anaeromyxobacteraceae bacterium]